MKIETNTEVTEVSETGRRLIFTGDGKGKTTAALGMALRASGHGMKVKIIQFVKNDSSVGEISAIGNLPCVEIVQAGRGFVPAADKPQFVDHRCAAEQALILSEEAIISNQYNLVILDEICGAISAKLINEENVIEVVQRSNQNTCVVMTGRDATPRLMDMADTVTDMGCIKHGYKQGIQAQKGVEF